MTRHLFLSDASSNQISKSIDEMAVSR